MARARSLVVLLSLAALPLGAQQLPDPQVANLPASAPDINQGITQSTSAPEPGTIALVATGLIALGVIARRRRTK